MSRWLPLAALVALAGMAVYGWLTYGGMVGIDLLVLVSSLVYQLGALPWEIRRNWKAKAVDKISYGLAFVGAMSYMSSTLRALMQPDWVDVGSRWWGMVGSIVISIQIIHYDKVRLSLDPPFIIWRAFGVHMGKEMGQHMTGSNCPVCKEESGEFATWPLRCAKCKGGVHFVDVDATKAESSIFVFTGLCDRCHSETKFQSVGDSPYPTGSSCWLWSAQEGWRCVTYEAYVTAIGGNIAYVAQSNVHGVVISAGNTPLGLTPNKDSAKLVAMVSPTAG